MRTRVQRAAVLSAVLAIAIASGTAHAAFPGANGRLVVADSIHSTQTNYQRLWTMAYDGSNPIVITPDGVNSVQPAWSADGEKIAFSRLGSAEGRDDIWTIDADGGNPRRLTSNFGQDQNPTWSPDGSKVAFQTNWNGDWEIYVVNSDGTGLQNLTNDFDRDDRGPAWSPDGTRIAFLSATRNNFPNQQHVYLMDPDGGNKTQLPLVNTGGVDWSPDGTRFAYTTRAMCGQFECSAIHVINVDGSNDQVVHTAERGGPHWSPDGTKFVYRAGVLSIGTMNSDGTNAVDHPYPGAGQKTGFDWQPITPAAANRGHVRPKSASPIRVPLVPAYKPCFNTGGFNRNHGPPLEHLSCHPPRLLSSTLTVGTPDANGFPADSEGVVRLTSVVGNPGTPADEADVTIDLSITDVRCSGFSFDCRGPGLDYEGSMMLDVPLRITDKLNGPGQNLSATVQDTFLRVPFTCLATASSTGSTCDVHTSAEAVVAGMVPEGKRSVWQPEQLKILDSGLNGTGYENCPPTCGDGDETVFMRQGIFVP